MGLEAACTATIDGREYAGKALLETDSLIFRGEARLTIPLAQVRAFRAEAGRLTVEHSAGSASFALGPAADKWAHKLANPKSLMDKLDVKSGLSVRLVGEFDVSFRTELFQRVDPTDGDGPADLVFWRIESVAELDELPRIKCAMKSTGALWIVAPKGGKQVRESEILEAGRAGGLVDTKVARFSETHTAHKFMVPRAAR